MNTHIKNNNHFILLIIVICVILWPLGFFVKAKDKILPVKKSNGAKWRLGYCEGGPYIDYQNHFKATIKSLMELGWIEKASIPELPDTGETKELWNWLSHDVKSEYLQFVADAYWSADWDEKTRAENKEKAHERFLIKKDIDLMFVLGTWAGLDLANNRHSVPVVIMSTSDPVRAKIIKSAKDSGYDHVHARCDPSQYLRQIRLFHDIFGFKKLGVVYENSDLGRAYGNRDDLQVVARERKFEIIECHADDDTLTEKAVKNAYKCFETLAPCIDALYVTDHTGITARYMPKMLGPIFKHKIPSWTTVGGSGQVKRGILMSISRNDYAPIGMFFAETIAKILNGARPRDLNQVFKEPARLAINKATAQKIGYYIPRNVFKVADVVFDKIESGTSPEM